MKTRWVILALVAPLVFACAGAGCTDAKAKGEESGQDASRTKALDELAEFLREVKWDTPIEFTQDFFQPGDDYRPPDVPIGLGDYRTLPLLADYFGIHELDTPPDASFAGVSLSSEVKPLDKLTPAEERTLMVRFRMDGPPGHQYNATTQLRLLPMMAMSGHSELNSIRDIVECEREDTRLPELGSYVEWIRENRQKLDDREYARWFRESVSAYYTNWITGGLFEPWHEEFSPGNGIVREITDEADRAQLHELAVKQASDQGDDYTAGLLEENPDAIAYFIYRLYGEHEIIKEGVAWCLRDHGIARRPLQRDRNRVIMALADRLRENEMSDEKQKQLQQITDTWRRMEASLADKSSFTTPEEVRSEFKRIVPILELAQHGEFPEARSFWKLEYLPLDDDVVCWRYLKPSEEQMLNDTNGVSLRRKLYDLAASDLEVVRSWGQLAKVVLPNVITMRDQTWIEAAESETGQWAADAWLSPITRRTFEPWHREWSWGNGYIAQITDDAMLARLKKLYRRAVERKESWIGLGSIYYERYPEQVRFYYVRLYGEAEGSIISEGIWSAWPPNPMLD